MRPTFATLSFLTGLLSAVADSEGDYAWSLFFVVACLANFIFLLGKEV